jgi:hypothetical protein
MTDIALVEAVRRAEDGLVDADLGHGLIKQRVARPGQGRSGGYRTVIAYQVGERAVFVYGFAKNERDNISGADLRDLAAAGALLLGLNDDAIDTLIVEGELWEVNQ